MGERGSELFEDRMGLIPFGEPKGKPIGEEKRMSVQAKIEKALEDLGDTPESVAEKLQAGGFTGEPKSGESCPVANYLRSLKFDGVKSITVAPRYAVVFFSESKNPDDEPREFRDIYFPNPVIGFIDLFDNGEFPELEDPSASKGE